MHAAAQATSRPHQHDESLSAPQQDFGNSRRHAADSFVAVRPPDSDSRLRFGDSLPDPQGLSTSQSGSCAGGGGGYVYMRPGAYNSRGHIGFFRCYMPPPTQKRAVRPKIYVKLPSFALCSGLKNLSLILNTSCFVTPKISAMITLRNEGYETRLSLR